MTMVYFIRHAESDTSVRDGRIRPLTPKGFKSRAVVADFLQSKKIDVLLSSPFKRAVDTISGFSEISGLSVIIDEDFREQKSSSDMRRDNPNFRVFLERQWLDFEYSFSDGECLRDVQKRNISALNKALTEYANKNIAIGTHATALSVIINHYDNTYGFKDFENMEHKLPWAVKMEFEGLNCIEIEQIDL
jgi:2,3-bisphosphoglycerate-dependent phosphoglycerate mutase